MDKEETKVCDCKDCDCNRRWHHRGGHAGGGGAIYGLGVIGALFYFLQHAATLSEYLWGIGKAIFWPALIVFKALTVLHI